jgi:hypothetical protein
MVKAFIAMKYLDKPFANMQFDCETLLGKDIAQEICSTLGYLVSYGALEEGENTTILVTDSSLGYRYSTMGQVLSEIVHINCRVLPGNSVYERGLPQFGDFTVMIRAGGAGLFELQTAFMTQEQAEVAHGKFRISEDWDEAYGQYQLDEHNVNQLEALSMDVIDFFMGVHEPSE